MLKWASEVGYEITSFLVLHLAKLKFVVLRSLPSKEFIPFPFSITVSPHFVMKLKVLYQTTYMSYMSLQYLSPPYL